MESPLKIHPQQLRGVLPEKTWDEEPSEPLEIMVDSRKVKEGCLFVAQAGPTYDSHQNLEEALKTDGVITIANVDNSLTKNIYPHPRLWTVSDTRPILAKLPECHAKRREDKGRRGGNCICNSV